PQNREEIAIDPFEELDAEPFETVCADRAQHIVTTAIEISLEKCLVESAHDETRSLDMMPEHVAAAGDADRRYQLVWAAAQGEKLRSRRRPVGRLVEPRIAANEKLVGADDERFGMPSGDAKRLRLGKRRRAFRRGEFLGPVTFLDLRLIDGG